jgi:hypothetical protein
MSLKSADPIQEVRSILPQSLGDGLLLRWGEVADTEALAEFNGRIHSDTDQPDEAVIHAIRDWMNGQHPSVGPSDFLVVVDTHQNNKIVSSLNLISQTWTYAGISFRVGRPEVVGTDPAYRRKGLVRRQFEVIHELSAARGELLQGITGIRWYYRQFGYEMALNLHGARRLLWSNISKLEKDQTENYRLRVANIADIPLLSRLYAIHCAGSLVARVRSESEWHYELTLTHPKSFSHHRFFIIEDLEGSAVGYLEAGYYPQGIAVRELAVLPGYSLRMVGEFLTRILKTLSDERIKTENRPEPFSLVSFALGTSHPIYIALDRQLEKQIPPYAWYIRIPDLPAFLRKIAPALDKRLEGSVMEGYSGTLRLSFYRSYLTLVFEQGKLIEVGTYQPQKLQDGDAFFSELTFLQLLLGYRSLKELEYANLDCNANARAAVLLEALFPPHPSDVSALG